MYIYIYRICLEISCVVVLFAGREEIFWNVFWEKFLVLERRASSGGGVIAWSRGRPSGAEPVRSFLVEWGAQSERMRSCSYGGRRFHDRQASFPLPVCLPVSVSEHVTPSHRALRHGTSPRCGLNFRWAFFNLIIHCLEKCFLAASVSVPFYLCSVFFLPSCRGCFARKVSPEWRADYGAFCYPVVMPTS